MKKRQLSYFPAHDNYKLVKSIWLGTCFDNTAIEAKYNKVYSRETSFSLKIGVALTFLLSIMYIAFDSTALTTDCIGAGDCQFFEIVFVPLFSAKVIIIFLLKFSKDRTLHKRLKSALYIVGIISINFYGPNSDTTENFPIYYRCIARSFQVLMAGTLSNLNLLSCFKNLIIDLLSMIVSVFLWRNSNIREEVTSFLVYNILIIVLVIITAKGDLLMRIYFIERLNSSFQAKYYSNCLNNMTCSLISISKDKVQFANKCFQKAVMNQKNKKLIGIMKGNSKFTIESLSTLINTETKKSLLSYHNQLYSKYLSKSSLAKIQSPTEVIKGVCQSFQKINRQKRFKQNLKGIFQLMNDKKQSFLISLRGMRLPNGEIMFNYIINNITDFNKAQQIKAESKLKENLFSYIAHEIKTPLLTLNLMMEDLKEIYNRKPYEDENQKLPPEFYELVSTSKNLSDSTIYLINDIIHYCVKSPNNTNELKSKLSCDYEIVKLSTILEDMYGILKCKLKYGGAVRAEVDHISEMDDELKDIEVKTDYSKVKQILYNLISNSIKYTKTGFIKLAITREHECALTKPKSVNYRENQVEHEASSSEFVKRGTMPHKFSSHIIETISITIEDTGIGISSQELLNELNNGLISMDLNKNYNLNSGLGIGLKIVKRLCALLKIKLHFCSTLNYGTKITLTFYPTSLLLNQKERISEHNQELVISIEEEPVHSSFSNDFPIKDIKDSELDDIDRSTKIIDHRNDDDLASILILESKNYSKTPSIQRIEHHTGSPKFSLFQGFSPPSPRKINNNRWSHSKIEDRKSSNLMTVVFEPSSESRPKLIICDDNELIRNSHYKLFMSIPKISHTYFVEICTDGIDILQMIKEDQSKGNLIKAVFTDENMEYMNGSKATALINELIKIGKLHSLKVFSVTAFEDDSTKKKILSSGITEILSKPIHKSAIEEILIKYNL